MTATIAQKQNRLLKLADYLDTVRPEDFDMGFWAKRSNREAECATTACAFGWAPNIWPRFLCLVEPYRSFSRRRGSVLHIATGLRDFEAAQEFFGLSGGEACNLFDPPPGFEKETPKQVASRLRKFVRTGITQSKPWKRNR